MMFTNPFSFEGRIRRTEYGLSIIIQYAAAFIISLISPELMLVLQIPLYWFMLAQGAKRCHDRGNSGWFQIIPFYGLWMFFADSDNGINEYGPNPKGLGNQEEPSMDGQHQKPSSFQKQGVYKGINLNKSD